MSALIKWVSHSFFLIFILQSGGAVLHNQWAKKQSRASENSESSTPLRTLRTQISFELPADDSGRGQKVGSGSSGSREANLQRGSLAWRHAVADNALMVQPALLISASALQPDCLECCNSVSSQFGICKVHL